MTLGAPGITAQASQVDMQGVQSTQPTDQTNKQNICLFYWINIPDLANELGSLV